MVIASTGYYLEITVFDFQISFYALVSNQACRMYISYLEIEQMTVKDLVTSQISLKLGIFSILALSR